MSPAQKTPTSRSGGRCLQRQVWPTRHTTSELRTNSPVTLHSRTTLAQSHICQLRHAGCGALGLESGPCHLPQAHERRLSSNHSRPSTTVINTTMTTHGVDDDGPSPIDFGADLKSGALVLLAPRSGMGLTSGCGGVAVKSHGLSGPEPFLATRPWRDCFPFTTSRAYRNFSTKPFPCGANLTIKVSKSGSKEFANGPRF